MMTSPQSAADGPVLGPSGIPLPQPACRAFLDAIIIGVGEASSWIWTALMLLIVYQVVQRYAFGLGSIKMEEMQWHLYGIGFMLAIPFAEIRERHVRIDVLAEHWPLRRRLWIEAFGLTFFLLPFSLFVLLHACPMRRNPIAIHEISSAPDGLPYRFVIKAFMAATFLLLAMAGGIAAVAGDRRASS